MASSDRLARRVLMPMQRQSNLYPVGLSERGDSPPPEVNLYTVRPPVRGDLLLQRAFPKQD
jgi:hypothetical protein